MLMRLLVLLCATFVVLLSILYMQMGILPAPEFTNDKHSDTSARFKPNLQYDFVNRIGLWIRTRVWEFDAYDEDDENSNPKGIVFLVLLMFISRIYKELITQSY